jgi:hypothetical protein
VTGHGVVGSSARDSAPGARPRPPFPYEARQWAEEGARVECVAGNDPAWIVHEGRVIGMTEAPTVRVQLDDGRIVSWVLGITRKKLDQPALDGVLRELAALIQQELELARSGDGYEEKAVAEAIVCDKVAPLLAVTDVRVEDLAADAVERDAEMTELRRDLERAVATREQATAEVERLNNAPIGDLYREIDRLSAERDQLRKANEVMANALQGSAYDTKDVLQLRADLEEARAELDAVKANTVVLPGNWREQVASDMIPGGEETLYERITGRINAWRHGGEYVSQYETLPCRPPQPDTEATKQTAAPSYFAQPCGECGQPLGEHFPKAAGCPTSAATDIAEQAPREPRVWSVGDDEPDDVTAVATPGGAVFNRSDDYRWRSDSVMHGYAFTWSDLVNGYPFVTEVIEDGAT